MDDYTAAIAGTAEPVILKCVATYTGHIRIFFDASSFDTAETDVSASTMSLSRLS